MSKLPIATPRLAVLFAAAPATLLLSPMPAMAQSLEEVVVTARKREVTLQQAPIAVSAMAGSEWDKSNIVKLDNFNGYVPGLTIAKNDGAGRVVTIRGIGWETAQNLASQPSVLTYIDGIYLANPLAMGLNLGELERVEVLRGPQGTEFGQGTTGGAINLVTRKPEMGAQQTAVEMGLGTYNTVRARASVNAPLGNAAAFRGSIQHYSHDGYSEVRAGSLNGYGLDDADSLTGTLAVKFEPSESVSVLARAFFHNADHNAPAQKNVDDPNPDPRELTQDYPGIYELDNTSLSLTIEWETPGGLTFKSLTGWQKLEKNQTVDGDRLTESTISIDTLGFFQFNNWDVLPFWFNDSDAISQEFALSADGERLDWVVGAYYLDHDNFNDFLEAAGPAPFSDFEDAVNNPSPITLPPFMSVLSFNEFRTVARKDLAVYGQTTYQINEKVALTAGLRFQAEDQRDFGAQFFGIFGGFDRQTDDSKATWKVGIDVNLSDDNFLYGLISTGWKNGGTNPGAVTSGAVFLGASFEPEEVTAFEIGSRNTFNEGRVRFNVTAFLYDHEHLQYIYEDPIPFAAGTGTIPKVKEYGIETEFSWLMSNEWQLDGMIAWQDGELKSDVVALDVVDFREALAPGVGLFTDAVNASRTCDPPDPSVRCTLAVGNNLNGNTPPKMPKIMARIGLTHARTFRKGSALTTRLEWVHRGDMQARVFNNPLADTIPSYNIVNLHLGYDLVDRPVRFQLSATNLFDEDGINNAFTNPFGLWTTSHEYIPPLEVIASVTFEF
jgi:iron complex outermembrane receptor protein